MSRPKISVIGAGNVGATLLKSSEFAKAIISNMD